VGAEDGLPNTMEVNTCRLLSSPPSRARRSSSHRKAYAVESYLLKPFLSPSLHSSHLTPDNQPTTFRKTAPHQTPPSIRETTCKPRRQLDCLRK
jgi:hypothetical protein